MSIPKSSYSGYYSKMEYYPASKTVLKATSVIGASIMGFLVGGPPGAVAAFAGSGALVVSFFEFFFTFDF